LAHPVNLHFGCFWSEADIEGLQKACFCKPVSWNTPAPRALLNSRSFPDFLEKSFQLLEKIRRWAGRDRAPQSQRRCAMIDGQRPVVGARTRVNRRRPMPGQRDALLPILAPMRKLKHSVSRVARHRS
jgi:hypothetical protein